MKNYKEKLNKIRAFILDFDGVLSNGMVYVTAYLSDPGFVREAFHMEPETAVRFWEAFAPAYFGADRPLSDIEDEVRPYAGLKTLLVERDMGCKMPAFRAALQSVLQP